LRNRIREARDLMRAFFLILREMVYGLTGLTGVDYSLRFDSTLDNMHSA